MPFQIPNDSATRPRWRSWLPTGPRPGWSKSGTACRVKPQSRSSRIAPPPYRGFGKRSRALARLPPPPKNPAPFPVGELPETASVPDQKASETVQPEAVITESTEPAVDITAAPQSPDVASPEPGATKKATRAKKVPVAAPAKDSGAPREGSKTSQVIAMLKREGGTTLEEIMTAMSWQKHTARAMLSAGGSLTKKHGLVVTSEKVGDKRVYSIKS